MTLIDHKIPVQRYELIRDRIYLVLKGEFDNQVYNYSDSACAGVNWFQSRTIPLDKTESASIVIATFQASYSNKNALSTDGSYKYYLKFMVNAKSNASTQGDQSSSLRLEKLMGIVRYVLEHPNYYNLLFGNDGQYFIKHTEVTNFQIDVEMQSKDAQNSSFGEMIFTVVAEEIETPNQANLLVSSDTSVFIELTDKGYQYLTYSEL